MGCEAIPLSAPVEPVRLPTKLVEILKLVQQILQVLRGRAELIEATNDQERQPRREPCYIDWIVLERSGLLPLYLLRVPGVAGGRIYYLVQLDSSIDPNDFYRLVRTEACARGFYPRDTTRMNAATHQRLLRNLARANGCIAPHDLRIRPRDTIFDPTRECLSGPLSRRY